jgi:hypothetical protein
MPTPSAAGGTPVPEATANRTPRVARGRGDIEPPTPAPKSQPDPAPADCQLCLQLADRVVQDIFSVSLTLAAARSLNGGLASARLDQAIDDLDGLVRGLRHTALAAQPRDSSWSRPNLEPSSSDSSSEAEPIVEKAADALLQVDRLLVGLWTDAVASDAPPSTREGITEATRLVRHARIAITPTAMS